MNPTEQPAGKLMESVKLHTYRIPIANIGQKHFFHFSDSHLSLYDDLSTKEQREKAIECEREWVTGREYFEKKYEGALPKARQISAKEHFENLLKVSEKGDCLILTGDMLDYISEANVRYLDNTLSGYTKPYMAVRGNHENPALAGRHEMNAMPTKCGIEQPFQLMDFGDILLLGLDNSDLVIKTEQLEAVEKCSRNGKPLLIAMHAPILTEMNRSTLEQAGDYNYFVLNHEGCPSENTELVRMIIDEKYNVKAVFTGHLHFQCVTPLSEKLWMCGASQGITGHLNEYWIGG